MWREQIGQYIDQADSAYQVFLLLNKPYNLLTAGTLDGHLADIEEQAQELFLRLVEQYADADGVTERLKASEPQSWVRKMNGIRNRANEVIMQEIVYG